MTHLMSPLSTYLEKLEMPKNGRFRIFCKISAKLRNSAAHLKPEHLPGGSHERDARRPLDGAGRYSGSRGPRVSTCQFLAKIRQNVARFRLYQNGILQVNMRLTAFFKIYQTI